MWVRNIPIMNTLSLNGAWQLTEVATGETTPATVPGCVHTDLMAANKLPDPWYRDQELAGIDLWAEDWTYTRTFQIPEDFLAQPYVVLRCEGLDTVAVVSINGVEVLRAENMFRTWEADVKDALKAGENTIEVVFPSPKEETLRRDAEKHLPGWNLFYDDYRGKSYLRKMACAFGWDWGPRAPTAGIWKDIALLGFTSRLTDVRVKQEHEGEAVTVVVHANTEGTFSSVRHRLMLAGEVVAEAEGAEAALVVSAPQLWWPNGLGEQPLYTLTVELLDGSDMVDTITKQIGLRKLDLVRENDAFGESFRFRVNGRDFFAKGANWIPCDVFPSRISDATYRDLLRSAQEANMNMIRVWGGGIYEHDIFYDLCDELGILIWQDFMFACSTYPTFDDGFLENVKIEAAQNVRRLRHHACLALWCGNNELEQGLVQDEWTDRAMSWDDYKPLFDVVLRDIVQREDGVTPYWPSSAHTPGENRKNHNDPAKGDAHAWSVWFGGEPFEAQRNWKFRFMSEFGFQSFPEPRTVEAFTKPEDRHLTGWIMDFHQRSGPGNKTIFNYLLDWFCPPRSFADSLWLTQLTQALCIQYAAEHARRIQGRMDGLLYWQLNDMWPGATWSSVDVHGRWKALQYFAQRFFAPVLVSIVEDPVASTMAIHVSNQRRTEVSVEVQWRLMTTNGETLREGTHRTMVDSQTNVCVETVECSEARFRKGNRRLPVEIRNHPTPPYEGDRDLVFFATAQEDGVELSRNLATFARPKHLLLPTPNFDISVNGNQVTIASDVVSPWTRMSIQDTDARFSDNFFHVIPGAPVVTAISCPEAWTKDALEITPLHKHWEE